MNSPQSFSELLDLLYIRKVPFFIVFFMVTLVTYGFLYAIDFIPEPVKNGSNTVATTTVSSLEQSDIEATDTQKNMASEEAQMTDSASKPIRIFFDSLDREVVVHNPTSRAVADLDAALLTGVVRHPDSADFKKAGNILILGHSSYLPNVVNKNFQAFNGIQKMTWGDTIRLQSETTEHTYRVQKVYQAKASEITVPFTPGKAMLTLATCNSFGSKEDRFIIEAILIDTKTL
jgi:LPXTG-site transpeptidase (sortase) family protein